MPRIIGPGDQVPSMSVQVPRMFNPIPVCPTMFQVFPSMSNQVPSMSIQVPSMYNRIPVCPTSSKYGLWGLGFTRLHWNLFRLHFYRTYLVLGWIYFELCWTYFNLGWIYLELRWTYLKLGWSSWPSTWRVASSSTTWIIIICES